MAGVALRRHLLEAAIGAIFVACVAVDGRMRSCEREAIIVLLNVFIGDLPSSDGVALFAIGAQLATMDVGVTILATLADVGENHFHVALRARD